MFESGSGQILPAAQARQLGDIRFRDVVIFTTFCVPGTVEPHNTLPNQGLERKIMRNLSGFSTGVPLLFQLYQPSQARLLSSPKNQLQCSPP
jgi:hypothetical protein